MQSLDEIGPLIRLVVNLIIFLFTDPVWFTATIGGVALLVFVSARMGRKNKAGADEPQPTSALQTGVGKQSGDHDG